MGNAGAGTVNRESGPNAQVKAQGKPQGRGWARCLSATGTFTIKINPIVAVPEDYLKIPEDVARPPPQGRASGTSPEQALNV